MVSSKRRRLFSILVPVTSALVCLGLLEVTIRLAIFSDAFRVDRLRQARHYADPWLDDDYWKLEYLFEHAGEPESGPLPDQAEKVLHPRLGWAPKVTDENPFGIVTDQPYAAEDPQPAVLFYGDSYVDGPEPMSNKLPQLLDPLLARRVLNYGVSGYGVGQIYLRFLDTYRLHEDPIVLIGIQDRDLDRTILSIRNRQKPVLEMEGGELVVRNTPVGDTTDYVRRNPVEFDSYLLRFVLLRVRRLAFENAIDRLLGYDQRQDLKLRLNRQILEAFKQEAAEAEIRLYVVLFYVKPDMLEENWREVFLKENLTQLGVPFFDTKRYLLSLLASEGGSVDDYWSDEHGHPNLEGNRVFAQGIAAWLEELSAPESPRSN